MVEKEGPDSASKAPDNGALFLVPGGVKGSRITRESRNKVSAAVKRYAQSHMRMGRQPEDAILFEGETLSHLHLQQAGATRGLLPFSEKGSSRPRVGRLK